MFFFFLKKQKDWKRVGSMDKDKNIRLNDGF